MKRCPRCDTTKPLDQFFRNRSTKDGLQGYCKPCWVQYAESRPDYAAKKAVHQRNWWLKRYGLTPEQHAEMLAEQNGTCASCHRPCASGRALAVDHCHTTGRVRGLLCRRCNQALGAMEDDPVLIAALLHYVQQT